MATFTIKEGDTSPSIQITAQDSDGNAVDCTGATGRFHMTRFDAVATKIDAAATLVTAASGVWRYDWAVGDTDAPGVYEAELEVTYADATVETFPNGEQTIVNVVEAQA